MPNEYSDHEFVKLREKVHELEINVARLEEQRDAAREALIIAKQALDHAQSVSNEWRQENVDQRNMYPTIPKVEGDIRNEAQERKALEGRVYVLEKAGSANQGKNSAFEMVWLKGVVVITMAISVIALAYRFVTGR